MKSRIIEELAQAELMLPNRVARALGTNERAKLRMSVLQAAMQHARDPEAQIPDFVAECGSTGLDAVTTRALVAIDDLKGAVMVQAMVFGNRAASGSGVDFSRDPSTGDADPVIDVLFEAQGEDVVSGRARPKTETELAQSSPAIAAELRRNLAKLERGFKDVQDVEFTIEDGRLWILQSRSAKRTPGAALKIAVDFVQEGLIAPQKALRRLSAFDTASAESVRPQASR
jgi:pyruvate,orthophosphate dikinase